MSQMRKAACRTPVTILSIIAVMKIWEEQAPKINPQPDTLIFLQAGLCILIFKIMLDLVQCELGAGAIHLNVRVGGLLDNTQSRH